jgi:type I restriction-modification system DNA methylase subunit
VIVTGDIISATNSIGKAGENTWSSRLSQLLNQLGYHSDFERIFQTKKGPRKPDLTFETNNGAVCIVSAKLGQSKETDAIFTAAEYQNEIGSETKISETFAIVFPTQGESTFILHVLTNENHTRKSWHLNSLEKLVEKIQEICEKSNKFELDAETSESTAIRLLKKSVIELTTVLTSVPPEDFENLFGGKNFFESILGGDSLKNKATVLRQAAAYLFINQVLFYHILSEERHDLKPITDEDCDKPAIFHSKYFKKVLDIDYRPVFGFDIADSITGQNSGLVTKKIVYTTRLLFPKGVVDHDIVGKIFHTLIPDEIRKPVGAYYTNGAAADLLADLAIDDSKVTVMDPSCGSGTLLVAAYKRKLELLGKPSKTQHKNFVERDLLGIDIMPFSAHLAAVNLALRAPLYETDNIRIAIQDSTALKPGMRIEPVREELKDSFKSRTLSDWMDKPPQLKETAKKGALSIGAGNGTIIDLATVDLVIMNPPFTSCSNLPADYKKALKERFSERSEYMNCFSGRISFQVYFLILADRFLKPGGKIACVIPASTFVGKAFREITDFLLKNYQINYIVSGLGRMSFSEDTNLSEILLVATKTSPETDHNFVLIGTKASPNTWSNKSIQKILAEVRDAERAQTGSESEVATIKVVPQQLLSQNSEGFSKIVSELDSDFAKTRNKLDAMFSKVKFIDYFSEVEKQNKWEIFAYELRIKGIDHYGASALSIMHSDAQAIKQNDRMIFYSKYGGKIKAIDRYSKEEYLIPSDVVEPYLRRISGMRKMNVTSENDYVIARNFDKLDSLFEAFYPKDKIHLYLKYFSEWVAKISKGKSRLCLARKVDISAAGTFLLCLNSEMPVFLGADSWGIHNISSDESKILTLWFNSTLFLVEYIPAATAVRGTWLRLDKRYLERMRIINPNALSEKEKKLILDAYEKIATMDFSMPLIEQLRTNYKYRKDIDLVFMKLLGFDKDSVEEYLAKLYSIVYGKISDLKKSMNTK